MCTLDAMSEGLRTQTVVPRLDHELPRCAFLRKAQFGILGKLPFPTSVLISTLGANTLRHGVEVMERREAKPWTHHLDYGILD